jgi:hypothetical protein
MKTKFLPHVLSMFLVLAFTAMMSVQSARADQPHMKSALESLRTARAELEQARPDKGGHRAEAIRLLDQAIEQTKQGIDYAD